MKLFNIILITILSVISFIYADFLVDKTTLRITDIVTTSSPAYAEIKLIPHQEQQGVKSRSWSGLWVPYQKFSLYFGYNEGKQISPESFDFVSLRVGVNGADANKSSSHATTVKLFEAASKKEDIKVKMLDFPEVLTMGKEYKVAVVSGKNSTIKWDVYLRCSSEKPAYVKKAEAEIKAKKS